MMRLMIIAAVFLAATVTTHPEVLIAEVTAPAPSAERQTLPGLDDPTLPAYKPPPKVKYPRARVGGVARGSLGQEPSVVVLVPDHVAWTSRSKPTLYWFIDKITTLPIIFTLHEDEIVRPILETPLAAPTKSGIQILRLKDHGVELKEETVYRWSISVQRDPESPSKDIVSGGMIERVPFVEIQIICPSFSDESDPNKLASCGLWYDAIGAICDKMESSPQDPTLCRQLAKLLADAGLRELAEFYLKCGKA